MLHRRPLSIEHVYELGLEAKKAPRRSTPVHRSKPSWHSISYELLFLPLRSRLNERGVEVISPELLVFKPSEREAAEVSVAAINRVAAGNADPEEAVIALPNDLAMTGRDDMPPIPIITFGGQGSPEGVTKGIDALIPEVNVVLEGLDLTLPLRLPELKLGAT